VNRLADQALAFTEAVDGAEPTRVSCCGGLERVQPCADSGVVGVGDRLLGLRLVRDELVDVGHHNPLDGLSRESSSRLGEPSLEEWPLLFRQEEVVHVRSHEARLLDILEASLDLGLGGFGDELLATLDDAVGYEVIGDLARCGLDRRDDRARYLRLLVCHGRSVLPPKRTACPVTC